MANRFDLTNPSPSNRGAYLQKALWQGQMAFGIVLFSCCVQLFKVKATKKKAIFIWNKFLKSSYESEQNSGQGGFMGFDAVDVDYTDLSIELPAGCLNKTKFWIDTAVRVRQDAEQMNRLVRFFSSNDRVVPSIIFDEPLVAMRDRTGDNPLGDMEKTIDGMTGFRGQRDSGDSQLAKDLKSHNFLPSVKQQLKDAGFNTKDIGLDSVTV